MPNHPPGYAKASQFDDFTPCQEYVLCIQVTVQDISLVYVLNQQTTQLRRQRANMLTPQCQHLRGHCANYGGRLDEL